MNINILKKLTRRIWVWHNGIREWLRVLVLSIYMVRYILVVRCKSPSFQAAFHGGTPPFGRSDLLFWKRARSVRPTVQRRKWSTRKRPDALLISMSDVSYPLHNDNDKGFPTGANMTCSSGEPRPIRRLVWLLITVWRRLMVILITSLFLNSTAHWRRTKKIGHKSNTF